MSILVSIQEIFVQNPLYSTIFLLVCSYFIFFYQSRTAKLLNKVPGPKGWPIFGNLFDFVGVPNEEVIPIIRGWNKKYGKWFKFWVINKALFVISNSKYAEKVLNSQVHIEKSEDYDMLKNWLGEGLLTSRGQTWHSQRRLLTPTFHFKILNDFIDVFNEQSKVFVNILKRDFAQGENKKVFNVFPYLTRMALDIICESAMGKTLNGQNDIKNENSFLKATYELSSILNSRIMAAWYQYDFVWNLTPMRKREKELLQIIHGFTDGVIKERKAEYQKRKELKEKDIKLSILKEESDLEFYSKKRLAFMDLLLESAKENKLTDNAIRDQTSTFMFAGQDTTSINMSWAIYLLGRYPHIQEKLHKEMDEIFGDDKDRPVTQDDINKMKYLENCIKESLRIYPSAPFIARSLHSDLELEKGLVIPGGVDILLHIFFIHRDESVFPNPENFDPDRFTQENCAGRNAFAYIPFSAGPRNCIGQKFAMLEEKVCLSNFFRNFRVESIEKQEDLILMSELILRPKNGINIKIYPRN